MRTLLICHEEDELNRDGLARWLASFSDLVGVVVLRETAERKRRRVGREFRRVGLLRMVDVLAFRVHYKLFQEAEDRVWEQQLLAELRVRYPVIPETAERIIAPSANAPAAEEFIRNRAPDLMIARCKHLLKESVFRIPSAGTYVMHPGICPEYRNAHGCFWALANGDDDKVGMTLLRIDRGVDTGPIYAHFPYTGNGGESHIVIQHRVVFDHLDAIREKLGEVYRGEAASVDKSGRQSAAWGQPWLTKYWAWKRRTRRRERSR